MKTGIFVALLTLCTGLSQPVLAQSPIPLSGKMDLALTQKLDAASPGDDVRVIIEFDMPQKAPGAMAADASLDARRAAVQSGRSAMMQRENMRGVAERRINRGVRRTYDYTPHIAFEGTPAEIEAFARNRKVKRIFIDEAVPPTLLNSTAQINAPQVWAQGLDGTGHAVAILDTGVDNDHAFFGNRIVAEACFSSNVPSQGATSVCPNGQETQFGNNAGDNCSLSVNGCNHGTHVAGIAAGNEGSSLDGVARNAPIIAIQVFSRFNSSSLCNGRPPCVLSFTSDQIAALDHVLSLSSQREIAAVNMSLGGGRFTSSCPFAAQAQSINNLRNAGVATVIASGNNGFTNAISSPACIPAAISVGSTRDNSDVVSSFSNSASFLDMLAPGQNITSSVPGNSFARFNGTSMAAPHVAGAISVLREANPNATVTQIENALENTGAPVRDTRNNITKPRIDLDAAVNSLTGSGNATIAEGPLDDFPLVAAPDAAGE